MQHQVSKRQDALRLAEELLDDVELERLKPVSIIRKASRLARLIDDTEAGVWLAFEVSGYPSKSNGKGLTPAEWQAAGRSGRRYFVTKDGVASQVASTVTLSQLQAQIDSAKIRLEKADSGNYYERDNQQSTITVNQDIIEKIVGSVYQYVSKVYQELRFGSAVATAFENVRDSVDGQISGLVPDAMPILTTALENAQTDDPEQWKNAAKACRDLIKATADTLRPAGPDKNGIKMGDGNYINRLVDWIEGKIDSKTKKELMESDLEHLGKRLDAAANGGNKGTHGKISKVDASRFIVGTYILLGDILSLNGTS